MSFTDDILKRCQNEIDNQTYCIEEQEDLPQVRLARGKANFIKAMVMLQDEWSDPVIIKESIKAIHLDGGDNPSSLYKIMLNIAQSYYTSVYDAVYELFD
jgi:hypothetical protein